MSLAELNTLYAAYAAALDAADYSTALVKLLAIKGRLITTANVTKSLGSGGTEGFNFHPADIDSLIAECRRLQAASTHATDGPWRQVPVTYARPDAVDEY
ncbi:MAG: hypothetical protein WC107_06310 [Patescibacteria group bacterium]